MSTTEKSIEELQKELAEKDTLLGQTRTYVDHLMHQINSQVEEIHRSRDTILKKNKELLSSMECARQVMNAVMTPTDALSKIYKDSFILFQPKDIIGGDFFWVQQVENQVYMAVGDCTGHGVSGAIISLMGEMLLKQTINEKKLTLPSEILQEIDEIVINTSEDGTSKDTFAVNVISDIAIDMLAWVHNLDTNEITVSSAHMPFYYTSGTYLERVKGSRHSIGVTSRKGKKEFEDLHFKLEEGMKFYFFSDGFSDQLGGRGNTKLGRVQFQHLLEKNNEKNFLEQSEELQAKFSRWKGSKNQTDDVMVIGLEPASFKK